MQRSFSIIALIFLFSFSVVMVFSFATPGSLLPDSSASSCPASQTITYVSEPIPTSFNYLNPSGLSTFDLGGIQWLSLTPFPLQPNGSLDWSQVLSNWMSSNSNFTQWTFHLRPGAAWSDGTPVTAQDVVDWASPSYLLNATYDAVGLHTMIRNVQVVNSDTVQFNLNVSNAQFPNEISMYYDAPMVPPSAIALGPANPLFGTQVADGPWYVSNYISGSTEAVLLPNQYWPGQKPSACAIDVLFVENSAQMIPFLASSEADLAGPLAFGNIAALQSHSNLHLSTHNPQEGTDLVYNITQYPYNMTQFRQALAYSINSSTIIQQSLFGFGTPSNNAQGEVPSSVAFYNPSQLQYAYNVSASVDLLHSIGFTGGGSASTPLRFPNGTAMSVAIYTDSSKAYDPNIAVQVGTFLTDLGISTTTQTLTSQNLGADYASNAFNIQNNLVIYSSGGPIYFSPWLDAQQGCNVMGTPGCHGWFATPSPASPSGQTQWEYPASADAQYQSNLTAIDNTPPTNITGQSHYLNNIQLLNAEYLPVIMLAYPDTVMAYNTQHWTSWPSYLFRITGPNVTMFNALQPASPSSTSTSSISTSSSSASTSSSSTTSQTGTTQTSSTTSATTSSKTSSSVAMNWSIIAVVLAILVAAASLLMIRRGPVSKNVKK